MTATTLDELYTLFCTYITQVTGRPCWRRAGIQAQPKNPYALIYFQQGPSPAQDVKEVVELITPLPTGERFQLTVWGTTRLECKIEFFRNTTTEQALESAVKFRNTLQLEERYWDVWTKCGLLGDIQLIDVSSLFRADTENRAEVRFNLYANLATTSYLHDINQFNLGIIMQPQDVTITKTIINETPNP